MKTFLFLPLVFLILSCQENQNSNLITVNGPVISSESGFILEHEHILVDFIGAERYDLNKWNDDSVELKVMPFLLEAKSLGATTLIDATPQYLGRDVELLKKLSEKSGLNIVTNTGLYGAVDRKYLPTYSYESSPEDLADRWIHEFEDGINNTGIKPGFIKISVNPGPLGDIEAILVEAACLTHKSTGLTIASHTGPAIPAFEQLQILETQGIHPSAFVWVHAQNEEEWDECVRAAKMGSWIGFDGLNDENVESYIQRIDFMKENEVLNRLLVSHDAGWYDPDQQGGGDFRPYSTVFLKLIPGLKEIGYSETEIDQIFRVNPFEAFSVKIRLDE